MTDAPPSVSIIVVSYNTKELLRRCLRSIEASLLHSVTEVIVLDNASTDGSADMVAAEFPAAVLVRSPTNLGFAAGVNEAARQSASRYLLLLNPDTEIRPTTVAALVDAAARRPDVGLVGGRTLRPDGTLDRRSCWGLPTLWSLFCFGSGLTTAFGGSALFDPETLGSWARDTERVVGALSGALLLIDRELWNRLDGFDEDYFMYSEDIDLAARAHVCGRLALVTPEAIATHVVGASSPNSTEKMLLVMTGKATYFRKNWSPARCRFALAMLWSGTALRALMERLVRHKRTGERQWITIWRARRRWLPGYERRSGLLTQRHD